MSDSFDPYHQWLGIQPHERPCSHYRLLGLGLFEDDPEVIGEAADQRMSYVRTFQTGKYSDLTQKILNELSAARVVLLNPAKRAAYDNQLGVPVSQQRPTPAVLPSEPAKRRLPLPPLAPAPSPLVQSEPIPQPVPKSPPIGTVAGNPYLALIPELASLLPPSPSVAHEIAPPEVPPDGPVPRPQPTVFTDRKSWGAAVPVATADATQSSNTNTPTASAEVAAAIGATESADSAARPKRLVKSRLAIAFGVGWLFVLIRAYFYFGGSSVVAIKTDPAAVIANIQPIEYVAFDSNQIEIPDYQVIAASVLPDGRRIMLTIYDRSEKTVRQLRIHELATGKTLQVFDHRTSTSIPLPDGSRAFSFEGKEACVWDLSTGETLRRIPLVSGGAGVALSPDGRLALVASSFHEMKVISLESGGILQQWKPGTIENNCLLISNEGEAIYGGSDKIIRIWDPVLKRESVLLDTMFDYPPSGMDISSDRALLAVTSGSSVRVWKRGQPNPIQTMTVQGGMILARFIPNQPLVLTVSYQGEAAVWNLDGTKVRKLSTDTAESFACLSPDASILVKRSARKVRALKLTPGEIEPYRGLDRPSFTTPLATKAPVVSPAPTLPPAVIPVEPPRAVDLAPAAAWTPPPISPLSARYLKHPAGEILSIPQIGETTTLAFSPSGLQALVSGPNQWVELWNLEKSELIQSLQQRYPLGSQFMPDGRRALLNDGGGIQIWNLADGKKLHDFRNPPNGNPSTASVAVSLDGRLALVPQYDGNVQLWDVTEGKNIRTFVGLKDSATCAALSNDGRFAAAGSGQRSAAQSWGTNEFFIRLCEVADGHELRQLKGHTNTVNGVAFSPNQRYLVSGSSDHSVRLWDLTNGTEIRRFKGHQDTVASVTFSPNGQHVLSASADGTVRLWDVESGQESFQFPHRKVRIAVLSPDGRLALSGGDDRRLCLWRLPDADNAGLSKPVEPRVEPREYASFPLALGKRQLALASIMPDRRRILISAYGNAAGVNSQVYIYDLATGNELQNFNRHHGYTFPLPDGRRVISTQDRDFILWDLTTGKDLRRVSLDEPMVGSVISPDGRFVLAETPISHSFIIWDVETCSQLHRWKTQTKQLQQRFLSNERQAIYCERDDALWLWDPTKTEESIAVRTGFKGMQSVAVSSDHRRILATDGTFVRTWNLGEPQLVTEFRENAGTVFSRFVAEPPRILTSGIRGFTIRNLDGGDVRRFDQVGSPLMKICSSPDASVFAAVHHDELRVWHPKESNVPPASTTQTPTTQTPTTQTPTTQTPTTQTPTTAPRKPTAKVRKPVPVKSTVSQAVQELRSNNVEAYKERDDGDRMRLVRKLMPAEGTIRDETAAQQYARLSEALDLSLTAKDLPQAWIAVDAIVSNFEAEEGPLRVRVLKAAVQQPSEPAAALVTEFLKLVDRMLSDRQYETAGELAGFVLSAVRKTRDETLIESAQARVRTARDLIELSRGDAAQATVRTSPLDADARLLAGKFLCLFKNQWEEGLPLLNGGNGKYSKLAQSEAAQPEQPDAVLELADGWWSQSNSELNIYKHLTQRRAVFWYQKVLQQVDGPVKRKIELRIDEVKKLPPPPNYSSSAVE